MVYYNIYCSDIYCVVDIITYYIFVFNFYVLFSDRVFVNEIFLQQIIVYRQDKEYMLGIFILY